MGCDIHVTAERRNEDGTWTCLGTVSADESGYIDLDDDLGGVTSRNYDLFAILADVRNGRGFAGIKTSEGFNPIAEPKGVPEDASRPYLDWVAQWDGDGHSHSYLTVAEIMAFDWTQTTTKTGVVDLKGLAKWKLNGSPSSWSGSISGPGIVVYDAEMTGHAIQLLETNINLGTVKPLKSWYSLYHAEPDATAAALELFRFTSGVSDIRPHFQVEWEIPYFKAGRALLSETLPILWRHGAPDDVRLVFFFDN